VTVLHAIGFGEPDGIWGFGWLAEGEAPILVAVRHGAAAEVLEARLAPAAAEETWRLDGEAVSLALEPSAPPGHGGSSGSLETTDVLCRVTGRLAIGGEAAEVGCLGWHGSVQGLDDLFGIASLRWLGAWLEPSAGFSLIALRPGKARGHASDLIAASLIDDPPPPPIDDPRLSTTYTDAGVPLRTGLELWPEVHDDDDPDADRTPHYPRRATGELAGERMVWDAGGFRLSGSPLLWRSHGHCGPGVYVLGQRP